MSITVCLMANTQYLSQHISSKLQIIGHFQVEGGAKNIRQITQFPPSRYLRPHKYPQQQQSQSILTPDLGSYSKQVCETSIYIFFLSSIRKTLNLLTDADSSTDTIIFLSDIFFSFFGRAKQI